MNERQILKQAIDKHATLQIHCLGVFRVIRPGETEAIGIVSKHKMWLLFKYLIVHKGSAIPTERIMELLWPGHNSPSDTAILRTTISRLKSLLEPKRTIYRKSSFVIYCKDGCVFNINSPYWSDTEEFERLCGTAHRVGESNRKAGIDIYLRALELYQSDFLAEDFNLEWTMIPREYYRRLYMDSMIEVASWLIENKDYAKAQTLLKKAIKIDPYVEPIQILLMKILLSIGDLKTAAEHYTHCSSLLYKELGVKPSEEWKHLYKQIREAEGASPNQLILEGKLETWVKDPGPYVCDSDFFWSFLLFERRRLTRNDGESSLVVLELIHLKRKCDQKTAEAALENLESVVYQKLRKCDVVCRLDKNHLALLLPFTGTEGSRVAATQISEFFCKHPGNSDFALQVKVKRVIPQ